MKRHPPHRLARPRPRAPPTPCNRNSSRAASRARAYRKGRRRRCRRLCPPWSAQAQLRWAAPGHRAQCVARHPSSEALPTRRHPLMPATMSAPRPTQRALELARRLAPMRLWRPQYPRRRAHRRRRLAKRTTSCASPVLIEAMPLTRSTSTDRMAPIQAATRTSSPTARTRRLRNQPPRDAPSLCTRTRTAAKRRRTTTSCSCDQLRWAHPLACASRRARGRAEVRRPPPPPPQTDAPLPSSPHRPDGPSLHLLLRRARKVPAASRRANRQAGGPPRLSPPSTSRRSRARRRPHPPRPQRLASSLASQRAVVGRDGCRRPGSARVDDRLPCGRSGRTRRCRRARQTGRRAKTTRERRGPGTRTRKRVTTSKGRRREETWTERERTKTRLGGHHRRRISPSPSKPRPRSWASRSPTPPHSPPQRRPLPCSTPPRRHPPPRSVPRQVRHEHWGASRRAAVRPPSFRRQVPGPHRQRRGSRPLRRASARRLRPHLRLHRVRDHCRRDVVGTPKTP